MEKQLPTNPEKSEEDTALDNYLYTVWLGIPNMQELEDSGLEIKYSNLVSETFASSEPPTTKNFLEQALLVSGKAGARGNTYGTAEENFQRIANLWNAQLGNSLTRPLTTADVSILMVLVKLSRLANCPTHVDSWVDIAGYVNCASQIQQGE